MSASQFVQVVQDHFPDMSLTILGDSSITATGKAQHYVDNRMPQNQFREHVRKSWFYATGIRSAYELLLSDANVAGAVLVDVGATSKAALRPRTVDRAAVPTIPVTHRARGYLVQ